MKPNLTLEKMDMFRREKNEPLIISGPCSAESEEQVLSTAKALQKSGIDIFRAGIWKPRTRPNSFEGYGSVALPWLQKVKSSTGMKVATEVANVWHVNEALKYGIDILWIGARTTANPFAIQEIANALRGTGIPVFVKNPVNPDIGLWMGAIERFNQAGIKKIAAIHRGFSVYDQEIYRNDPRWQIPIELKRLVPELPLITDPSHICGSKTHILAVAQKALDLSFDGLFIESHIKPEEALSDRDQQLTPGELSKLLKNLSYRSHDLNEKNTALDLKELRGVIDYYDDELLEVLKQRMRIAERIGCLKKDQNSTIYQGDRWNEILETRLVNGKKKGLSKKFLEKLFRAIHDESINKQNRVYNNVLQNQSEKLARS